MEKNKYFFSFFSFNHTYPRINDTNIADKLENGDAITAPKFAITTKNIRFAID
jgi:hypothetical protein